MRQLCEDNLTRRCIFKELVQRKCKCHKIIRKNNWNKFLKCQHYFLKKDRIFDSLHNYFISVLYQKNLKKMHQWALCVIFWEWAENIWIMCIYVVRTRSQLVFKSEFQIFFPSSGGYFFFFSFFIQITLQPLFMGGNFLCKLLVLLTTRGLREIVLSLLGQCNLRVRRFSFKLSNIGLAK